MKDNGLSNVMELIKRQKWKNLFKRREFVHVDSVKEFYARMTVIHLKKKDVVKSSVKGVAIEFDHLKLTSILGIPGNNGISEYIKDVWEESKYTKPLEITRFTNNETLTSDGRVKSSEMKPFRRFIHFLVMKNVVPRFEKGILQASWISPTWITRFLGDWHWENRRRDEEVDAPEKETEEEVEARKDFDWEAVIDEAAVQGKSGLNDQFFMLKWMLKNQ
ncbi:hypothetical protein Dimus_033304 [Dionaea muscipula]